MRLPSSSDAYDQVPYSGGPIEWAAPERLAVTSLLHGGPRPGLDRYRMLELGSASGANLLPLAFYRRHAHFVGVEGSLAQSEAARARAQELELTNLELIHSDFREAAARLQGQFDFIVVHGVLSWVSNEERDAVLRLCAQHLSPGGLLYLNYNSLPGWNLRGMVRHFLLAQTAGQPDLMERGRHAQEIGARMAALFETADHPYSKMMATEFSVVREQEISYVIHDYLEEHNYPYWRSEFMALASTHGFEFVADADFNYRWARIDPTMAPWLSEERIIGSSVEDTIDLLLYRQLHSPLMTPRPFERREPSKEEIGDLFVATRLTPSGSTTFEHPSGEEVTASGDAIREALTELGTYWPRGKRARELFASVEDAVDDLRLLHWNGLIELRCVEPGDHEIRGQPNRLNELEARDGDNITTAYHTSIKVPQ